MTKEPLRGKPTPMPPNLNLLNPSMLRATFAKFQSFSPERARQYTVNVRIAVNSVNAYGRLFS